MSHVVKLNLKVTSLKALKRATKKLGLKFNDGVKSFNYWSSRTDTCDHTITNAGYSKAIGVVAKGKKEFELKWDPDYLDRDTQTKVGPDGANLKKEYAVAAATLEAEKEGMYVTRYDNKDGSVRLEAELQ